MKAFLLLLIQLIQFKYQIKKAFQINFFTLINQVICPFINCLHIQHQRQIKEFQLNQKNIIDCNKPVFYTKTTQMEPQLTPQQYESVLKYMEATSQQDFIIATQMLKQYNFNINTAVNAKFNGNNFNQINQNRNNQPQNNQQNDNEVVTKYIRHVQKQNENWSVIGSTYNFTKNFIVGLVKFISEIIMPQPLLRKFIRSNFYLLYKDHIKINFHDDKFHRLLMNTRQISYKSCFVVISSTTQSDSLKNLLNKDDIVKKINQNFLFIGFVEGDNQVKQIQNQRPPQIVICRFDVYKQMKILKRFVGAEQINQIDVNKLNRLVQQSRNQHKRDKNVLVKYRNFIRRQYYGPMQVIEQEEEEIINFVARQDTSQHIRQQNQQYRRIEEEEVKRLEEKKKQQQMKSKIQEQFIQVQEERKVRKMSIPDEPINGEIIRFLFRCPDGTTKTRNFFNNQKVEILYHWVQTNQEIQLQDNKKRQFEILYSYPPTPLTEMKDKIMKQVFESDQEKLLIRQL